MDGKIFNSSGTHVAMVVGSSVYDLIGNKLYDLKGKNIYKPSGELVGHLAGETGSSTRLESATDRLFPRDH